MRLKTTPSQSDFTGGCGISPHRLLGLLDLSVQDGITTGWDIPTQEIDLLRLYFMTDAMQCQRLTVAVNKHFRRFVLKKESILFFIYNTTQVDLIT